MTHDVEARCAYTPQNAYKMAVFVHAVLSATCAPLFMADCCPLFIHCCPLFIHCFPLFNQVTIESVCDFFFLCVRGGCTSPLCRLCFSALNGLCTEVIARIWVSFFSVLELVFSLLQIDMFSLSLDSGVIVSVTRAHTRIIFIGYTRALTQTRAPVCSQNRMVKSLQQD